MIRLNVFVQADTANYTAAIAEARLLTEHSRQEEGCVAYDVFQSVTRGDVFMICETWADQASLDAHTQTEHFKHHVERLKALAEMKIERFEF